MNLIKECLDTDNFQNCKHNIRTTRTHSRPSHRKSVMSNRKPKNTSEWRFHPIDFQGGRHCEVSPPIGLALSARSHFVSIIGQTNLPSPPVGPTLLDLLFPSSPEFCIMPVYLSRHARAHSRHLCSCISVPEDEVLSHATMSHDSGYALEAHVLVAQVADDNVIDLC